MIRKQLYITAEQDAKLKRLAGHWDETEAQVVRRAIDSLIENEVSQAEIARVKEAAEMSHSVLDDRLGWSRADMYAGSRRPLDDNAWQEELAFIKERARSMPEGGSTTRWNREDVYDKRRLHLPG